MSKAKEPSSATAVSVFVSLRVSGLSGPRVAAVK